MPAAPPVNPPVAVAARSRDTPRSRDAARSRESILAAAERRFAAHGYDGTSLAQIGTEAGLSRAAPAYFFGSKDRLYTATLQRVFAAREAAVRPAAQPLADWARDGCPGGRDGLARALDQAVRGYLAFLADRPAFVALVQREALAGGRRLAETPHASTALHDALAAIRATRLVKPFDVAEALTAFVALCFFPLAHATTFTAAGPVDLDARRRQVVDVMLHLLT